MSTKNTKYCRVLIKPNHPKYEFDSIAFLVTNPRDKQDAITTALKSLRKGIIDSGIESPNSLRLKVTKVTPMKIDFFIKKPITNH